MNPSDSQKSMLYDGASEQLSVGSIFDVGEFQTRGERAEIWGEELRSGEIRPNLTLDYLQHNRII